MIKKEKQAEKRRIKLEHYAKLYSTMEAENYQAVESIYSSGKASFLGICCSAPFVAIILISYWIRTNGDSASNNIPYAGFIFVAAFFLSIIIHEVLHGIGWCIAGKIKWSHIHITIGRDMPLCHCDVPIKGSQYLVGVLLPVVILGFIPAIISFIVPGMFQILFAIFSITIAGGDLLLSLRVAKHLNDMIIDHPTEAGFVAFTK